MSGVAQWLACWAHNPKVRGSKSRSAIYSFHCSISLTRMDGGAYTQRQKYLSVTITLTRTDGKKNKNERERERERHTKKNSKALILQCPVS